MATHANFLNGFLPFVEYSVLQNETLICIRFRIFYFFVQSPRYAIDKEHCSFYSISHIFDIRFRVNTVMKYVFGNLCVSVDIVTDKRPFQNCFDIIQFNWPLISDKRIRLGSRPDIRTDYKGNFVLKSITSTRNSSNTVANLKRKQDMPQGNHTLRRPKVKRAAHGNLS